MPKFNSFISNAPFLCPLKTSENLTVFLCFQGVEKGCTGNEWGNTKLLTMPAHMLSSKLNQYRPFFSDVGAHSH